jgi:hypothetical protein
LDKIYVLLLPSQDNTELSEDDDQKTNKGQEVEELGKTPLSIVSQPNHFNFFVKSRRRSQLKLKHYLGYLRSCLFRNTYGVDFHLIFTAASRQADIHFVCHC